jgi:hypothetical protein
MRKRRHRKDGFISKSTVVQDRNRNKWIESSGRGMKPNSLNRRSGQRKRK